ncbi:MAG TPA: PQQ-binding-like beta-propeller repeat protein [Bryobacteraceae bacterium]|nr:PQQ-binding-like beta-propeller repeat protein [Bryobacteraceae bacterium]
MIWGDQLFVSTAVSAAGEAPLKVGLYGSGDSANDSGEQSWDVYCLDRRTGKLLWKRTSHSGAPKVKRHTKATHANTTVATDGKYLVAFFGSEGLYVYDLNGKLLWEKDLGVLDMGPEPDLQWGFASSPVIYKDTVVVQADCKNEPFLTVLSLKDGREIWRISRKTASRRSWATPAVFSHGNRTQIVANGWPYIVSYDYGTGKELWRLKSEGDIPVPTPIASKGLIYVTNAHGGWAPLYAIKPDAQGDITPPGNTRSNAHVAWSEARNGAYMQTPLIYNGLLYSCSDRGVLKVYDAATGQKHYEQRLGKGTTGFSASPVAAGGRIYFTSEEGEVFVIRAGTFELLSTNAMGEICMSTPGISNGVLYYHTRGNMIAIR